MRTGTQQERVTGQTLFTQLAPSADGAECKMRMVQLGRRMAILMIALSSIIGTGCQFGKGHGGGGGSNATLVSITITPASPSVFVGQTIQLSGYGTMSDGSQVPNNGQAAWTSSKTSVATIDPGSGIASGLKAGTTTISASYQGVAGQTTLTVNVVSALTITTNSLPGGTAGVAYSATQLAVTGGVSPYSWNVVSGLPNGLSLSTTGVLSGTPTASG